MLEDLVTAVKHLRNLQRAHIAMRSLRGMKPYHYDRDVYQLGTEVIEAAREIDRLLDEFDRGGYQ